MSSVSPYYWFSEVYDSIYEHLIDYRSDVLFLLEQYRLYSGLDAPAIVLDLGCGTGSHLVSFAQQGVEPIGVDASLVAIEKARLKLGGHGRGYLQDMRLLDLGDRIDLAISMFTSLGYIELDSDIVLIFRRLARRMDPRSVLILELWQPRCIPNGYVAVLDVPYRQTGSIHRVSRFDTSNPRGVSLTFDFKIRDPSKGIDTSVTEVHFIRTFDPIEISGLLKTGGFRVVSIVKGGSFQHIDRENTSAGPEDFRIIVVALMDPST